jgi:beta-galactosidase
LRGSPAPLPTAVEGVRADGSTESLPVGWAEAPGRQARPGIYTVTGTVPGTGILARAVVTVYDVASVQQSHAVVPVGTPPDPAADAKVTYTDGVTQYLPVSWPRVPVARYSKPGRFVLRGTVSGISVPARLLVRVTRDVTAIADVALAAGPAHPTADASFSGGVFTDGASDFGTSTTIPAAMLDGVTDAGGWSNRHSKAATQTLPEITDARPEDWVSVAWPRAQNLSALRPYFTIDANHELPASVTVS